MHRRSHTYVYFLTESGIKRLVIPSQENLSIKLNVSCVSLLVCGCLHVFAGKRDGIANHEIIEPLEQGNNYVSLDREFTWLPYSNKSLLYNA